MKFKFTWAHGIAVALGMFMIFILSLLFMAGDVGELVTDNYYEKSLTFEKDIEAESRANLLATQPEVVEQANGFKLIFPEDYTITEGTVYLLRPNNQELDYLKPLKLNGRKEMLISSVNLVPGEYDLALSWEMNGEKYLLKKPLRWHKR